MEHKEFRVRIPWPTIHWPRSPLSTWLPSRGNVLFTLVMIAVLLWAQAAGAVSFLAPRNSQLATRSQHGHHRLSGPSGRQQRQPVDPNARNEFPSLQRGDGRDAPVD